MKVCEGPHRCDEHEKPVTNCRHCPPITEAEICDRCRSRLRRAIDRIIYDYCLLHAWMADPIRHVNSDADTRRGGSKAFGHPAEWASDTMRRLALALWSWEDAVRDHLGHSPVPSPGRAESRIVAESWRYLTAQFDALANFPGSSTALSELEDLHGRLYAGLGRSREVRRLPTPCPDCGNVTLRWTVDFGRDSITCVTDGCGREVKPEHYLLYARVSLDELVDAADTDAALVD